MANKTLTATVRLNTSQAEKSIDRLINKLNKINGAINKNANSSLERQFTNSANAAQRMSRAIGEGDKAAKRLARSAEQVKRAEYEAWWVAQLQQREYNTTAGKLKKIKGTVLEWANNQSLVNNHIRSSNSLLGMATTKLKGLINTYLGVMGTGALINTSDMITSAENKLNNVNATTLGSAGYNADGTYSQATLNATQDAMDKMYVSAQKVRMSYTDMMTNVSKSMTLAGDAFQGSIDNAIRFQEIMAESYAIGGASAAEMSSSMYQLMQALGAGVLAGDELRSVREGAPLAYNAIEEFAQGVYNTEESLKDLGSQGKITSDMVVAAMLSAGDAIDASFAQTAQTFTQTWTQIKNAATKAFEPVAKMLRDGLNEALDNGLLNKIETVFSTISKALQIAFKLISNFVDWLSENWEWLKHVIVGVFIAIATYSVISSLISIGCAIATKIAWWNALTAIQKAAILTMIKIISIMAIVVATVLILVYVFYLWKTAAIDTCSAIIMALGVVAVALLIIGIITGNVALLAVSLALMVVAAIFYCLEEICGYLNGFVQWFLAVCTNIGIGWQNMCNGMKSWFINAMVDMLESCEWLLNAINKIRKALGKDAIDLGSMKAEADALAANSNQPYVDTKVAWSTGYQSGYNWGAGVKDKINNWGSKFQTGFGGLSLDNIGNKLGLDFGNSTGSPDLENIGVNTNFPSASDPAYALDTSSPEDLLNGINDKLGGVKGDTGSIADSMELTQEDMEYMRKIADMEWKKEFTLTEIKVDMNNNNQINGDSDLDGIVTRLADKLYEELDMVANGVYA